ncbi:dihydrofolate reductase [Aeribacillus pallidus]|jgi:dihydrofolate reductase|uniref:dihydrofolate reductase n=1 Tax=Aeribacillus pallidus TaxID=33936 RepID=UPI001D658EB7|nr:dihydrofolate reductase [Bacillus sp. (in: firmicutes)]
MISFIWAMDENRLIGKNNQLPWHLPEDLKYFKRVTMGHPIVMGRSTFESIGKPLPGRENIILTRDDRYKAEGCTILHSLEQLLDYIDEKNDEVFITGGAQIFQLLLPFADRLYVTRIHYSFEGDTYFPDIDWSDFRLVKREKGPKNEENPYDYEFEIYERFK